MISEFKIGFNFLPVCLSGLICLTGCRTSQPETTKKTVANQVAPAKIQPAPAALKTPAKPAAKKTSQAPAAPKTPAKPAAEESSPAPAAPKTPAKPAAKKSSPAPAAPKTPAKPAAEKSSQNNRVSGFQPTFLTPAGKNAFDYAYAIYRSSPNAPTGIYTYQGVVFVIVNLDTRKVRVRLPKGPAMLKAKKMLEARYPLPARYSLKSRQLESRDYRKQKIFRYVLAYRESDILDCCRDSKK